jgi:hypothetical protein
MGDIIPELVREGRQPRVLLDYSGELLHGLRKMGCGDVLDRLPGPARFRLHPRPAPRRGRRLPGAGPARLSRPRTSAGAGQISACRRPSRTGLRDEKE